MEHYFVLSTRRVSEGQFEPEPGSPRYLKVPWGELPRPDHEIKAAAWVLEISDLADGIRDENASETGDVLFFVHGYNNDLQSVADRTRWLQEDLEDANWRGVVAAYDWPSDNSTLNYLEDRKDASKTALRLVDSGIRVLARGRSKGCETNVHLLGHSTGAYVIVRAFELARDIGELHNDKGWNVAQVAFIGGDVSARGWEDGPLFERVARLTNYQNGYDNILAVSNAKRFGTSPRAGRVGISQPAHSKVVNVDCSDFFAGVDPDNQAKKTGTWNHSWHIGNPTWTLDLAMTIEGRIDRHYLPTRKWVDSELVLQAGARPKYERAWIAEG
jgi:esterase/lipase superfamily enzyme